MLGRNFLLRVTWCRSKLCREAVDALSLEVLKARSDGALRSLI